MINLKVRIKNKLFWLAFIPAVLYLVTAVLELFGVNVDLSFLETQLGKIVEAIFSVLMILGVVVDPTTEGVADSVLAMTYEEPKPQGK